jgi:hypothetical protein
MRSLVATASVAAASATTAASSSSVTPVATTATAAPTSTTAIATTTAAAAPLFGNIDAQRAAFKILAVELGDCLFRAFWCRHFDETESARLTADAIEHEVHRSDFAARSESLLDQVLGCVKRKIANVQTIPHACLFS